MPDETRKKRLRLEQGTIVEVARILAEKHGTSITADGVSKRLRRRSDAETLMIALKVSDKLRKKKERRIQEMIAIEKKAIEQGIG
jgi:hypothetical protein